MMLLNPYRFAPAGGGGGNAGLTLNGNQYLSQPLAGRINGPATILLDFSPSALPPVTGGITLRHQLMRTSTDGSASPSLTLSPGDTEYNGLGMYIRSGAFSGSQVSLIARSALVAEQRYKVAVTIPAGVTDTEPGTLLAYANGTQRQAGSSVALSRPDEICGTSAAGGYSLTGKFMSLAICAAELSAAQIAAIAADDGYDLSTLPGLTDLWLGGDVSSGVIANCVASRPALTLINKP